MILIGYQMHTSGCNILSFFGVKQPDTGEMLPLLLYDEDNMPASDAHK